MFSKHDLFDEETSFKTEAEIKEVVRESKYFNSENEDPDAARTLLLFETSKQRTWLAVTDERLYCILDDIKEGRTNLNWSMPRSDLLSGGNPVIPLKTHATPKREPVIDVGNNINWHYSERLFRKKPVDAAIKSLILTMLK